MKDKEGQRRQVVKERVEKLSHIVNMSANEARNLQEFRWMLEDRLKASDLPASYWEATIDRKMVVTLWQRFQTEACCIGAREMEALEAKMAEESTD